MSTPLGGVFGRWTVSHGGEDYVYPSSGKRSKRLWCLCTCGSMKLVHATHLLNGTSTSCGCYNREVCTTHGMSHTREYASWWAMVARGDGRSLKSNSHYFDKGITVCDRWNPAKGGSFENFYKDLGKCPEGFEIERLDYEGDYSPENCSWADEGTQASNRGKFKNNTSGKTGVVWSKGHGKWRVFLHFRGVKYEGGLHRDLQDAIARRKSLEREVLGHEKRH